MAAYSNEIDGTSLLLSRPSYHDDQKTYISLCSFRAHAMATIPSLESPDNNHFIAMHCVSSATQANDTSDLGIPLFGKIHISYLIESILSSTIVHVLLICDLTYVASSRQCLSYLLHMPCLSSTSPSFGGASTLTRLLPGL